METQQNSPDELKPKEEVEYLEIQVGQESFICVPRQAGEAFLRGESEISYGGKRLKHVPGSTVKIFKGDNPYWF